MCVYKCIYIYIYVCNPPSRRSAPRTAALRVWGQNITPEITNMKIHWKTPPKTHGRIPVKIHWASDNPLEHTIDK